MSIGVFVDVENMVGGLGKKFASVPLDALVMESVHLHKLDFDDVGFIGLYAPWKAAEHVGLAQMHDSVTLPNATVIETPFSPGHDNVPPKSAADNHIVVDVAEGALTDAYDRFVVISGDFDMLPMVTWLRQKQSRFVVGVGRTDATKFSTAKAYNRFAFYSKRDIVKVAPDPQGFTGNAARLRRALIDLFNENGSRLPVEFVSKRLKEIVQKEWREYAYEGFLRSTLGVVKPKRVVEALFPDGLLAWRGAFIEHCENAEVPPTFRSGAFGTELGVAGVGERDDGPEVIEDWDDDRMVVLTL